MRLGGHCRIKDIDLINTGQFVTDIQSCRELLKRLRELKALDSRARSKKDGELRKRFNEVEQAPDKLRSPATGGKRELSRLAGMHAQLQTCEETLKVEVDGLKLKLPKHCALR